MEQALKRAHAGGATIAVHRLRPCAAVRTDKFAALQKITGAALDGVAFVRMHMGLIGGESPGIDQRVDGDLTQQQRINVEQF